MANTNVNITLPHWVAAALPLVGVLLATLVAQQKAGNIVLPLVVLTTIPFISAIIAWLTPAVSNSTNVLAAKRAGVAIVTSILGLVALGCSTGSCLTKQQGSEVATVTVDSTICVLNHFSDPPERIAAECGIALVQDVVKILDAGNAMASRKAAGMKSVSP